MQVYRLSKRKYANTLSGIGAAKFGNRWNSKGIEMIYTANSRALAMAEVLVHLSLETLPNDFMMIEVNIPNSVSIDILNTNLLGENWNQNPHTIYTQKIGDEFIESMRACVLKVPSSVVQGDFNYLINPYHKDMKKVNVLSIVKFPFDKRMFP